MDFFLKKLVSLFLYPVTWCVLFGGAAVVLLFLARQKTAIVFFLFSFSILILFSSSFLPDLLLKNLESQFSPLKNPPQQVKFIVVLGGGASTNYHYPANTVLRSFSLSRLIEGIRIFHRLPHATLILSGGKVFSTVSEAKTLRSAAIDLGIPSEKIEIENVSKDTFEETQELKKTLGSQPFILVTSAFHMPRAIALFKKQGMHPIPAPTQFLTQKNHYALRHYIPNSSNLVYASIAIHEYVGLLWAKLTGEV